MSDLIRRSDAIEAIEGVDWYHINERGEMVSGATSDMEAWYKADDVYKALEAVPSSDRPHGWIPVKWHYITDEEREREGYPKAWAIYLDCEMPQDGQEILVQTKSGDIRWDVCCEDDGFSLDSGWDWVDDIVAWMPLPEPWKGADNE